MKETVTKVKQVEEEEEVIICDYCRLVSSEDIGDDEEFGKAMLNPTIEKKDRMHDRHTMEGFLQQAIDVADEHEALNLLSDVGYLKVDKGADLCPGCQEALFGDSPDSMIRTKVDQ